MKLMPAMGLSTCMVGFYGESSADLRGINCGMYESTCPVYVVHGGRSIR